LPVYPPSNSSERGDTEMYFTAKKDIRYGIGVGGLALLLCIISFFRGDWFLFVLFAFKLVIFAWIWFGTGYSIRDDSLEVKSGPYHKIIPFSNILRIKRSKSAWPYKAALFFNDMLEIKFKYDIVSISPLNSSLFIDEIKQKCPEAEFSGV
jgi:hypothetical protein